MDYTKIAEYQIELDRLAQTNIAGRSHDDIVAITARQMELRDLIVNERNKPTM